MRRRAAGCLIVCVALVIGFVLIRWAKRIPIEELNERPVISPVVGGGLGPFADADHLLVLGQDGKMELLDWGLNRLDSAPPPADVNELAASRDLRLVAALEYHRMTLIDTRTKARKELALGQMSTEVFVSPDADQLWIGEYETGVMHRYALHDVDARRVATVNVEDEARRVLGPPTNANPVYFRTVALVGESTTVLHRDSYHALLMYDWAAGRAVGSIALPDLSNHPRFVQSPDRKLLAIVSNRLVFVDLKANAVVADVSLEDGNGRAGDFNAAGDLFYVAHSAPDLFAFPLTHRGGQIDEFDLQGCRLRTWHSKANRIREFGCRGPVAWMVTDEKVLKTFRLP